LVIFDECKIACWLGLERDIQFVGDGNDHALPGIFRCKPNYPIPNMLAPDLNGVATTAATGEDDLDRNSLARPAFLDAQSFRKFRPEQRGERCGVPVLSPDRESKAAPTHCVQAASSKGRQIS
jgi:hypothetical protein